MDHGKRDTHSGDRWLASLIDEIVEARNRAPATRALLVGISGIDGSGKGFVSAKVADALRAKSLNVALISADDWLNLPDVCMKPDNYAEHFYEYAIRFNEMFDLLILPLVRNRAVNLIADRADAQATSYRKHTYEFDDIDIVLVEGIFLFKPAYRKRFHVRVWIDCPFECALERVIKRGQEGLPPNETRKAFQTIYFPAQRIHFARDNPQGAADFIIQNEKASQIHSQS